MDEVSGDVRCGFYLREPRENDQWRYTMLIMPGWEGNGRMVTAFPPVVGDLISLYERGFGTEEWARAKGGLFRVVARSWMHSAYGSVDWPYGHVQSKTGPLLDIIVELAEGMFADEAELSDAERAEFE